MIRVILAGEGKNELGSFGIEPAFRDGLEPGVLERARFTAGWIERGERWEKTNCRARLLPDAGVSMEA